MKILHSADLHLGRRPQGGRGAWSDIRYDDYFTAFDAIVELAIAREVDCLTLGGDIFDSNAMLPATLARTEAILEKLREHSIPVVATWGNHDRPGYGGDSEFWLAYLEDKGLLMMPRVERTIHDETTSWDFTPLVIEGVHFWTPGWWMSQNEAVLEALAAHLAGTAGEHVVIAHIALSGGGFVDQGAVAADQIRRFQGLVSFMGGGHFHSFSSFPREAPFFFVPGAPEYFDFAERACDKAVVFFDTASKEWERIPLSPRPKHDLVIESTTVDPDDFIRHALTLALTEAGYSEGEMIRLEILCRPGVWLDAQYCESWLETERGALKASVTVRHVGSDGAEESFASGGEIPRTALIKECIAIHEIFRDFPEETMRLLDGLAEARHAGPQSLDRMMERIEEFCIASKGEH